MSKLTLSTKPIIVSEKFLRVELGEECVFKRQPFMNLEALSELAKMEKEIDNFLESYLRNHTDGE